MSNQDHRDLAGHQIRTNVELAHLQAYPVVSACLNASEWHHALAQVNIWDTQATWCAPIVWLMPEAEHVGNWHSP